MLLISIFLFLSFVLAEETAFWVSPNGSDLNPGTREKPFLTISKAKSEVQQIEKLCDIRVFIEGGHYEESLIFDNRDSGKGESNTVFYQGYGKEKPVITGSRSFNSWELYDKERNIYVLALPTKGFNFRQMYVNWTPVQRSVTKTDTPLPEVTIVRDWGYELPSGSEMVKWKNHDLLEIVVEELWRQSRCMVDHIVENEKKGAEIHIRKDCWELLNKTKIGKNVNLPTKIENNLELISNDFEWSLDSHTGRVYMKFPEGSNVKSFDTRIPVTERIVYGEGNVTHPIERITFQDLVFTHATWTAPNDDIGFVERQSNIYCGPNGSLRSPPGAVEFSFVRNVNFRRNEFVNLGAIGLFLNTSSQNCIVESNVFHKTSSNAFKMGDMIQQRTDARLMSSSNVLFNNSISFSGHEFYGGTSIVTGYMRNSSVIHNNVFNSSYNGMHNSYGSWETATVSNFASHNKFCWNHVADVMVKLFDGGSFHSLGNNNNSILAYNLFEKSHSLYGSFYLDDFSRFWEAHHNVVFGNVMTALIKGGDMYLHDMYWQDRGEIEYKGHKKQDITYQNNDKCAPCDPICRKCGEIVKESNHVITNLNQAPKEIIQNVGVTHRPLDLSCRS